MRATWCRCVLCIIIMYVCLLSFFFFFKQKTAYEMRISDWSSDVCSSDLGKVLNIASLGAFWPSFPGITLYAGAKSFLVRMTNTLAVEYVGSGVTFTVLCPFTTRTAFIDTPNTRGIVEKMPGFMNQTPEADRKRVGRGKGGAVRVKQG